MNHSAGTLEAAILLGNQMDINASTQIALGTQIAPGNNFDPTVSCTGFPVVNGANFGQHQCEVESNGAQSAGGSEMDILQAALHLADISEEELKAEELHTSLYPMQDATEHSTNPNYSTQNILSESTVQPGLISLPTLSEDQVNASLGATNACTTKQPPNLLPATNSQLLETKHEPGIVMTTQVQASPSVYRKRKNSSTANTKSTSSAAPRPRGRPKSPKGLPKNTPKKKPQPFFSTYNGQKVMYIPVPCPNEDDGEEPTDIAEAAQGAALSAAAAAHGVDIPSQITANNALSQQHAKVQKQSVGRKVDKSPTTSVASSVTQGNQINSSLIQSNSGTGQGNCDLSEGNSPVVITNTQVTTKPTATAPQVVKISSNVASDEKIATCANMPIKVQILPHNMNNSKSDQAYADIKQSKAPSTQATAAAVVVKPQSGNTPVQVISTNTQNGTKAQSNQTANIIANATSQSSGTSSQPMITFQIVQNSKTGTIEFIPVGPSNGKTQIQIIPKPVQPKAATPAVLTGETTQTPGVKDAQGATGGVKKQLPAGVGTAPKKSKSKKPTCGMIQVPKKRGRPSNQNPGGNISTKSKEMVDQLSAALKSLGATVSPVFANSGLDNSGSNSGNATGQGNMPTMGPLLIPKPVHAQVDSTSQSGPAKETLATDNESCADGKQGGTPKQNAKSNKKKNKECSVAETEVKVRKLVDQESVTRLLRLAADRTTTSMSNSSLLPYTCVIVPSQQSKTLIASSYYNHHHLVDSALISNRSPVKVASVASTGSPLAHRPRMSSRVYFGGRGLHANVSEPCVDKSLTESSHQDVKESGYQLRRSNDGSHDDLITYAEVTSSVKVNKKSKKVSSKPKAKEKKTSKESAEDSGSKERSQTLEDSPVVNVTYSTPPQPTPDHVQAAINYEQNRVLAPDFSRPLEHMRDATLRLLPYHVLQDTTTHDLEFLAREDELFEEHCDSLMERANNLFTRFQSAMLKQSMREAPTSDLALLERIVHQSAHDDYQKLKEQKLLSSPAIDTEVNVPIPVVVASQPEQLMSPPTNQAVTTAMLQMPNAQSQHNSNLIERSNGQFPSSYASTGFYAGCTVQPQISAEQVNGTNMLEAPGLLVTQQHTDMSLPEQIRADGVTVGSHSCSSIGGTTSTDRYVLDSHNHPIVSASYPTPCTNVSQFSSATINSEYLPQLESCNGTLVQQYTPNPPGLIINGELEVPISQSEAEQAVISIL